MSNLHLQLFQEFTLDKTERALIAASVVSALENGEIDPLKFHVQVKTMEDIINRFTDTKKYPATSEKYRSAIMDAAMKNGKKFDYSFGKFEIKEAGVKYDYSKCGDSVILDLHAKQAALDAKVKEREKFLQALPESGLDSIDEETGEVNKIYRPSKSSTTTVQVTLL